MKRSAIALVLSLAFGTPAPAQRPAGVMRVRHESHPAAGSRETVRFLTTDTPFDLFLLLCRDPARGPLRLSCLRDPLGCLGDFQGTLVPGVFQGGAAFSHTAPRAGPTLRVDRDPALRLGRDDHALVPT